MRVGVWVHESFIPSVGGGYSYMSTLIGLIDKNKFEAPLKILFVSSKKLDISTNKDIVIINMRAHPLSFVSKMIISLTYKTPGLKFVARKIKAKNEKLNDKSVRNQLKQNNIDLLYYLTQTTILITNFPFITTNWDLGHVSMYSFPEVMDRGEYERRHQWYSNTIQKAQAIFCESEAGKKELINYLNINPNRIKVVPIFPGDVISLSPSQSNQKAILEKYNIEKEKYFFYPAQFWAHKNHYNLIKAFKEYLKMFPDIKLIFCGSDKGNLHYILDLIKKEDLSDNVLFLGFITNIELNVLYRNALALVMPTFLGPTNMPLLEARVLGCPILCSNFDGHIEQLGDGALYIDPESIVDIKDKMIQISDVGVRNGLLKIAEDEIKTSYFNGETAMEFLERNLLEVSSYVNVWSHN